MKRILISAAFALFGAVALPSLAAAQTVAYAVPGGTTNMRAGPGADYPVVAFIRGGSAVEVYGCLSDFSWCDSSVEDIRGWVSTTRLEFQYAGDLVPIPRYYQYFEAPTVTFDFGYWDRYYQDEPFYRRHGHHGDHHRDRPPHDRVELPGPPGIFPEEGGQRGEGRHRDRHHGHDNGNRGDYARNPNQIFPEEGGRQGPPPPVTDELPPSGLGSPPVSGGVQGFPCPPDNVCQ